MCASILRFESLSQYESLTPIAFSTNRYSRLKQRMIGERCGGLDEGLVSRDRKAIREKIETEPKIRKWFQHLNAKSST